MISSEKRSLVRFLAIYLSSTFTLFALGTYIFYTFQKHQIIDTQNNKLQVESQRIIQEFRHLHETFDKPLIYPQNKSFNSAIYNLNHDYIFGTFKPKKILWNKEFYQIENQLYYLYALKPYYLGASYIVISQPLNLHPLNKLLKLSLLFLFVAGVVFTLLGLFLGRLFIAPMKESIELMDRFIQDTTHELNTPISTILTNIELIDTFYKCEGKEEMKRIAMASKTLSRLYEDLTYLKLNHNYHREIENINLSELLQARIEFFRTLIEAKSLELHLTIEPNIYQEMDRNDAIRLVDNLLSNAIKYNKKRGFLTIKLDVQSLEVINAGVGIKKENIGRIQKRFQRANKSEGGFGIGLDIISQVVERYHFNFTMTSTYQEQTKVTIVWKK